MFVTAPELTFVHLATELSFGQLLALGYELCGNYPLPDRSPAPLVRTALTTPLQLVSFADAFQNTPGVKLARSVARQVLPKSASPMETEVAALAFTSAKRGGLEMERAVLNKPLTLSRRAAIHFSGILSKLLEAPRKGGAYPQRSGASW